ncbi:MAG: hypothetical protein ABF633_14355 [Clostridium sp.]|uniref:Uncharacterized protein n=1 Tax=Clostridium pasteurianum BC1 TaxID=86416 RepID=R4K0U0_CLOPA|nr:hypothetical protein [Clostridium pasteurianum]AGK96183.1 hypothetical protein Clopa_1191 [Clostridium pasteurianum BC1]
MSKKIPYLPKEREYFEAPQKKVKAYSERDYTELPDNVIDPIVSNNISNVEFDYTYDPLDDYDD